jgi:hypothetical protein
VHPKSILGFSILILGVMIRPFKGKVKLLPPLIKKETDESTTIEENA